MIGELVLLWLLVIVGGLALAGVGIGLSGLIDHTIGPWYMRRYYRLTREEVRKRKEIEARMVAEAETRATAEAANLAECLNPDEWAGYEETKDLPPLEWPISGQGQ